MIFKSWDRYKQRRSDLKKVCNQRQYRRGYDWVFYAYEKEGMCLDEIESYFYGRINNYFDMGCREALHEIQELKIPKQKEMPL